MRWAAPLAARPEVAVSCCSAPSGGYAGVPINENQIRPRARLSAWLPPDRSSGCCSGTAGGHPILPNSSFQGEPFGMSKCTALVREEDIRSTVPGWIFILIVSIAGPFDFLLTVIAEHHWGVLVLPNDNNSNRHGSFFHTRSLGTVFTLGGERQLHLLRLFLRRRCFARSFFLTALLLHPSAASIGSARSRRCGRSLVHVCAPG